jgi:flagellar protein FlaG
VNTDIVQALTATATKPASSEGNAQKRATPAAVPQEAVAPAKEPKTVPQVQKVQETVAAVAAQIESYLRSNGRDVELSVDSESGETVISVRDASTGDLIRQIPSAEALRLSQSIGSHQNSLVDVVV